MTSKSESQTPFGMGMASDPMAFRRGGKKLAMEDVCYYQWPLPGIPQVCFFLSIDSFLLSLYKKGCNLFVRKAKQSKFLPCSLESLVFVMDMVEYLLQNLLAS